jgi:NADP-dependent alcohol dehydrogenase
MFDFDHHTPVRIVFGKDSFAKLPELLKNKTKVLLAYGGGSIRKNGVYDRVVASLKGIPFVEFSGIEPNPEYETLMKAVELCKTEKVDFILAVGGGSVIDGCKFVSHAALYEGKNPWDIAKKPDICTTALPLGCVLTLSATGTEMNYFSVVSRRATGEKLGGRYPFGCPVFSLLDPATTLTLPVQQVRNGIVDPFVHVTEQYLTYDVNAPLQGRQAEAILMTLIEEGPKALAEPNNVEVRANLMWCATQALNGVVGLGVPQDWATHNIGHELTASFGLDHAVTLAIVLPALLKQQLETKQERLAQYGRRVWGLNGPDVAYQAIARTEAFFRSVGMKTRLEEHGVAHTSLPGVAQRVSETANGALLGERSNLGEGEILRILEAAWPKN